MPNETKKTSLKHCFVPVHSNENHVYRILSKKKEALGIQFNDCVAIKHLHFDRIKNKTYHKKLNDVHRFTQSCA